MLKSGLEKYVVPTLWRIGSPLVTVTRAVRLFRSPPSAHSYAVQVRGQTQEICFVKKYEFFVLFVY